MTTKRVVARTERQRRLSETVPHGEALDFVYQVRVLGQLDLENEWRGWRLRGAWLISPAGDRINAKRLAGMLFVESNRVRFGKLKKAASQDRDAGIVCSPLRRVQGGTLR